jgi:hypothetical protein
MVSNWIFTASNGCQLDIHSQQRLPTGYSQPAMVAKWQPWHFSQSKVFLTGFFPNYLTTCFLTISEDAFLLVASNFFVNRHRLTTTSIDNQPVSLHPMIVALQYHSRQLVSTQPITVSFTTTSWLPTGHLLSTDLWLITFSLTSTIRHLWLAASGQPALAGL